MTMSNIGAQKRGNGKPKRTVKELAEEFGISWQRLSGLLARDDAPKAVLHCRSAVVASASWYEPGEVRKWYRWLQHSVGHEVTRKP